MCSSDLQSALLSILTLNFNSAFLFQAVEWSTLSLVCKQLVRILLTFALLLEGRRSVVWLHSPILIPFIWHQSLQQSELGHTQCIFGSTWHPSRTASSCINISIGSMLPTPVRIWGFFPARSETQRLHFALYKTAVRKLNPTWGGKTLRSLLITWECSRRSAWEKTGRRRLGSSLIQHRSEAAAATGLGQRGDGLSGPKQNPSPVWVSGEGYHLLIKCTFCDQYKLLNLRKMTAAVKQKFTVSINRQWLLLLSCSPLY